MLQPRRPLVGLVARCARTARLGPRPPGPAEVPPAAGGQAGGGAGRRGLLGLLARQCSCVTGQRARRARRAWYRGGGSGGDGAAERARRGCGGGGGGGWWWWWWWRGLLRGRPAFAATGRLMATLAGVFVWDGQRIEEEELQRWVSAAGALGTGTHPPKPLSPVVREHPLPHPPPPGPRWPAFPGAWGPQTRRSLGPGVLPKSSGLPPLSPCQMH